MEAQQSTMEKTLETSELLEVIVETEAEAGVRGMSVAGGGKEGLFVKDVLKGSPAARVLSLQEGDQLLSARVYFDNIKYEDALQILKCAEPYKISFCLKRTVPSAGIAHKPGTPGFEIRGPRAKVAKLNIQSLTSLKKKKKKVVPKGLAKGLQEAEMHGRAEDPAAGKLEVVPVDVEFSLPKFSKLRKAKSAGEVAAAEPSPDISPRLSSLETRRRRLKFPRLKVKEVVAATTGARVEGPGSRLEVGLPKLAVELNAGAKGDTEEKASRFTVPSSKAKAAKGEAGGPVEAGFQPPQVELDLPLPKTEPRGESPKASAKGEGFRIWAPQVELPKVSAVQLEVPEGGRLKLPVAEVAAPKIDVDLSLPKLEGPAPAVAPKGEGFRIKIPKFGGSVEEAELKKPSAKAPTAEVSLAKGRARVGEAEEKLKAGVTMPALDVGAPSVDLEIPLPKARVEMEVPEVSVTIPSVSLPVLGPRAPEEGESKLPQVALSVGKLESPKTKAKGPKEVGGEGRARFPVVKVPSLDISVPKVSDMHLPGTAGEPLAPARKEKTGEAAEVPGFKFQMPQISLPKLDLPAKAAASPPQDRGKFPKPEGDSAVQVSIPKVDLSLPSLKLPDVPLPKAPLPKPALDVSVEKPRVEVAAPSARLSFPSATVPVLEVDWPQVGIELDLPKAERESAVPADQGAKWQVPALDAVSKGLAVEISVPTCQVDQPELEPSARGTLGGPGVSGVVAMIPKVDLAFGKELAVAEGEPGREASLGLRGKVLPAAALELKGPEVGAGIKLPSVEIPAVQLPAVTVESAQPLEPDSKRKLAKFALPKFSISGPKVRKASPEASTPEAEGPEAADRGSKMKMPKFGISFPKSKWGAEVEGPQLELSIEGKTAKPALGAAPEALLGVDSSETRMKLPAVDVEMPRVAVDIGLPGGQAEWSGEEPAGPSPGVGVDLPDIKLKVPKFSLPKFGGKDKEGDLELEGRVDSKARVSKFKMPSFGITRREAEVGGDAKAKKAAGSPKEKPRGAFVKMPGLKLSSPKAESEKGPLHIQAPELEVKIPQVELPKISVKGASAGEVLMGAESPSLRAKLPSLEITVPCPRAGGEKPGVDVSEADIRGYEGDLKIPKVPSIEVSAPKVELDIGLPRASAEELVPQGAPSMEAKIRLPAVELPKFGKGEYGGAEAAVQLLGQRLSLGREGEAEGEGGAEASLLGAKIRVPKVDLSLPKTRLSDVELPLTEGEAAAEGPEGRFKMPSVELTKFSAPKVKAPDLSLEGSKVPKVTVSGPAIKLPTFGGSGSDGEGETESELPRVPQLELKAPKLRGNSEMRSPESGAKDASRTRVPSLPLGLALGKPGLEGGVVVDEGKFRLKLPSVSITKAGVESSTDTQPLCPPAEGADLSFKMPQIALPDVGFSVDHEGKGGARGEAGKLAGLGGDVGGLEARLKMPKLKVPAFGAPSPQGGVEAAAASLSGRDLEGKRAAFKMPGLEISAPSLKAHAEYEVEGAQLRHGGSQGPEVAGRRGTDGQGPGSRGEAVDAEVGRRYKVKIPKFGLSLPKAGLEAGEGTPGQEGEGRATRSVFGLGRPKGAGAEGSSGLLEGEDESSGKGVMAKLKLKPAFGLSLSKPKGGAEVNGEPEEPSAKLKVPRLGFSKAEGAAQLGGEGAKAALQNGGQDGKGKLGKLRLPQVELSSPAPMGGADPELNLQLVRADEAREGGGGAFASLRAARLKSPKISFSGFKKRNGEAAPAAVLSSARTEMASLEPAKGEKAFSFPKLALSPKSHAGLEAATEPLEQEGGVKVALPRVGFSGDRSSEEPILEAAAAAAAGGVEARAE
ncbi:periaxin [Varanus komodoensis]|uniref:periaxin n=1 Tax=Varanus komodoensis TaxID=61221 RepID=UPI001CF79965|nr:periaxin [Varanus komodoensis]